MLWRLQHLKHDHALEAANPTEDHPQSSGLPACVFRGIRCVPALDSLPAWDACNARRAHAGSPEALDLIVISRS